MDNLDDFNGAEEYILRLDPKNKTSSLHYFLEKILENLGNSNDRDVKLSDRVLGLIDRHHNEFKFLKASIIISNKKVLDIIPQDTRLFKVSRILTWYFRMHIHNLRMQRMQHSLITARHHNVTLLR